MSTERIVIIELIYKNGSVDWIPTAVTNTDSIGEMKKGLMSMYPDVMNIKFKECKDMNDVLKYAHNESKKGST